MKRILLALLLLVVLGVGAFAAAFWHAGGRVEAALKEEATFIAGQSALKVVDQHIERGVFSSRAEVTVELQGQAAEAMNGLATELLGAPLKEPLRLTEVHDIYHGPFPSWLSGDFTAADARFVTRLRINPELAAKLPEIFGADAPAILTTDFFADNSAVAHVNLPPIQRELKPGEKLVWQGMSGEVRYTRSYDTFKAQLTMPRLEITSPQGQAVLANLGFDSDSRRGAQGLWVGTAGMSVATVDVGSMGMKGQIAGLAYRASVQENGTFIDIGTDFSVKNAEFGEYKLGPAKLALSFNHLHGPTLVKMRNEMEALDRTAMPDDQRASQALALVMGLYGEIMKQQPEFAIKELSFTMPEGDMKFSLAARLNSVPEDGAGPAALANAIQASADLDVAESLAKQLAMKGVKQQLRMSMAAANEGKDAAEVEADLESHAVVAVTGQINGAIEQGLIQRDGNRLKTKARWENGGLVVNGRALPTPFGAPPAPAAATLAAPQAAH